MFASKEAIPRQTANRFHTNAAMFWLSAQRDRQKFFYATVCGHCTVWRAPLSAATVRWPLCGGLSHDTMCGAGTLGTYVQSSSVLRPPYVQRPLCVLRPSCT